MAKFSVADNDLARLAQIEALLNGTVAAHGTAITNLQTDVVELDDRLVAQAASQGTAIINNQTDIVDLDDRVTDLEGAP